MKIVNNQGINKLDSNLTVQKVKNKILVISGKGGVGKTTVAVNLAFALSEKGFKTGLLLDNYMGMSKHNVLENASIYTIKPDPGAGSQSWK